MSLRLLERLPPAQNYAASLGVLDAMTGDRAQTTAMLRGDRLPGAELAGARLLRGRWSIVRVQAATGAADGFSFPGLPSGPAPAARLPAGAVTIAGLIVTAAAAPAAIDSARERAEVDGAIARFGLDPGQAADVLAARAYVWTAWMAPFSHWRLGYLGAPDNEAAAQAVMRYERSHPGTLILATTGRSAAALAAIDTLIDEAVEGFPDAEPLERTSSVDPALSTSSARARGLAGIQAGQQLWQAHHLIPFAAVARLPAPVQKAIAASGWQMDSAENLIALPANLQTYYGPLNARLYPVQRGPHPMYDAEVSGLLSPVLILTGPAIRPVLLSIEQYTLLLLRDKLYGYHRFLK